MSYASSVGEHSSDVRGWIKPPQLLTSSTTSLVVIATPAKYILIMSAASWDRVLPRLTQIAAHPSIANAALKRLMIDQAEQVSIEQDGTIGISQDLLLYAGIAERLVCMDRVNAVELWSPRRFATDWMVQMHLLLGAIGDECP